MDNRTTLEPVRAATLRLLAYCRTNGWAGYDPYDALNSRLFEALPFLDSRIPRLCLTQALKRSPVNIRPLALVPKTQNPKALALFLAAVLKIDDWGPPEQDDLAHALTDRLIALKSPGAHYCWGFSFPWQTRTTIVPRWCNVVCTSFVKTRCNAGTPARVALADHGRSAAHYPERARRRAGEPGSVSQPDSPCPFTSKPVGAALLCRVYR
jgi:hypothetical protein